RATVGVAGDTEAAGPGGGAAITYDRNKLFVEAAKLGAVGALLAWVLSVGQHHRGGLVNVLALTALGIVLLRAGALLLRATAQDLTAVAWDNQQICVRTLTASRQVPWQSVESVRA